MGKCIAITSGGTADKYLITLHFDFDALRLVSRSNLEQKQNDFVVTGSAFASIAWAWCGIAPTRPLEAPDAGASDSLG